MTEQQQYEKQLPSIAPKKKHCWNLAIGGWPHLGDSVSHVSNIFSAKPHMTLLRLDEILCIE
jgi:hypothetical protein